MKKVLVGVVIGVLTCGGVVGVYTGYKHCKSKRASKKEKELVEKLVENIKNNVNITLQDIEDLSYESINVILDAFKETYPNKDAHIQKLKELLKVDESVDFLEFVQSYYKENHANTPATLIILEITTLLYNTVE